MHKSQWRRTTLNKGALGKCGYPNWAFHKANKSRRKRDLSSASLNPSPTRVTIPYVAGLSERLKNTYKTFGITTSYKPSNTLRSKLVNVKDKQPKEKRSNVVYGITCANAGCDNSYVGETKQSLKTRANQHRRPSSNEAQNSAVFIHLKDSGHNFAFEDVRILDREDKWHERGVKEAIWERVEQPSLNKTGVLRLHNITITCSNYRTPGIGLFGIFRVVFKYHVTLTKAGQLPVEVWWFHTQQRREL